MERCFACGVTNQRLGNTVWTTKVMISPPCSSRIAAFWFKIKVSFIGQTGSQIPFVWAFVEKVALTDARHRPGHQIV